MKENFEHIRDIICDWTKKTILCLGLRGELLPPEACPDKEEIKSLYEEALIFFRENNTFVGGLSFKGMPVRATCGSPDLGSLHEKNSFPVIFFRIQSTRLATPIELGYSEGLVSKIAGLKNGLVFFCGDQGSGKTTGICSILREKIVRKGGNAVMFEAPSEYSMSGIVYNEKNEIRGHINQVSLSSERLFPEAAALSLRMASPSIVMYGEIRVEDGVRDIISNSLSSHLVMTTLHGLDIATSLSRFLDKAIAGRPDYKEYYCQLLADSFALCIHQKIFKSGEKTYLEYSCLEADDECRSSIFRGSMHTLKELSERQKINRKQQGKGY